MATPWREIRHKGGDTPESIARRAEFAREREQLEAAYRPSLRERLLNAIDRVRESGRR